jgi:hypothetical protein
MGRVCFHAAEATGRNLSRPSAQSGALRPLLAPGCQRIASKPLGTAGCGLTRWPLPVTLTGGREVTPGGGQLVVEWSGTVVLTTPRLVLRTFRRDDLPLYAALNADPEVARYLGGR